MTRVCSLRELSAEALEVLKHKERVPDRVFSVNLLMFGSAGRLMTIPGN